MDTGFSGTARAVRFDRGNSMNAPPEPTLGDLQRRFGAIPFSRICYSPAPGTATEEDVTLIRDSQRRIFELVDGILVEKIMASRESEIAAVFIQILRNYIQPRKLGKVLGEAGMYRRFTTQFESTTSLKSPSQLTQPLSLPTAGCPPICNSRYTSYLQSSRLFSPNAIHQPSTTRDIDEA